MKINANIIILLDDANEHYQDMKLDEIAKADIILGVLNPGTTTESTYVYKSRWTGQGYSTMVAWTDVLKNILGVAEKATIQDAALAQLPVFDPEKAVKDEEYRKSIINWLKGLP